MDQIRSTVHLTDPGAPRSNSVSRFLGDFGTYRVGAFFQM
jgi:hypothetical protein